MSQDPASPNPLPPDRLPDRTDSSRRAIEPEPLSGYTIEPRSGRRSLPAETLPQALLRLLREIIVELLRLMSRLLAGLADLIESPRMARDRKARTSMLDLDPLATATNERLQTVVPAQSSAWQKAQRWWVELLEEIRSLLPAAINQRVSNSVLTATIAVSLGAVLWAASGAFSAKSPPTRVAMAPASPEPIAIPSPDLETPLPPVLKAPPAEPTPVPIQEPSSLQLSVPDLGEVTLEVTAPPEVAGTPEVTAPPVAAPPIIAPSPLPAAPAPVVEPPPLKLTPEQQLIASIQDQVAAVSDRYTIGLIQSVQANFRSSRLSVNLGEGWYQLSQPQQDQLANDILKRSQALEFGKLELLAADGTLLARSPVVGNEMVVLQRSLRWQAAMSAPEV